MAPGGPHDSGELVGEGDSGLVVAAPFLQFERPGAQSVERSASTLSRSCREQHGPGAMDQQGSKVRIALFADAPEPSPFAGRVLPGSQTQPADKVTAGGEALNLDHRGAQRGGGERSDAWNLQQSIDDRIVIVQAGELAVDVLAALFERVDLSEQFEQASVQQHRHGNVRAGQRIANGRNGPWRANRDADTKLAQAAAQKVEAPSTGGHPLRAQAMQLLQGLLIDRFDRHGADIRTACCLDQRRGVGRIGLVSPDIGSGVLSRQQHDLVTLTTQPAGVVVSRATGFHNDAACRPVDEEPVETRPAQALPLDNMPALIGQGDLEDILCQVNTDSRSIYGGLLLLGLADALHPAWHIDAESFRQEESISSFERTREG